MKSGYGKNLKFAIAQYQKYSFTLEAFSFDATEGTIILNELYCWMDIEDGFLFFLMLLPSDFFWHLLCRFLCIFAFTHTPDLYFSFWLWRSKDFSSCWEKDGLVSLILMIDWASVDVCAKTSRSSSSASKFTTYFSSCISKVSLLCTDPI